MQGENMSATKSDSQKVVLVYSGGLDTSICIPLMKEEYGYKDVITVTVDVGQPREDIQQAEEKARKRYEDDGTMTLEKLRGLCLESDLPIPVMYYAVPFKGTKIDSRIYYYLTGPYSYLTKMHDMYVCSVCTISPLSFPVPRYATI